MPSRTQITLDPDLNARAKRKARELGISLAEYVRMLIRRDLDEPSSKLDLSALLGIGDSGGSDIARYKHEYLGEAVEAHYESFR